MRPLSNLNVEDFADRRLIALQNHVFRAVSAAANVGGAGPKIAAEKMRIDGEAAFTCGSNAMSSAIRVAILCA